MNHKTQYRALAGSQAPFHDVPAGGSSAWNNLRAATEACLGNENSIFGPLWSPFGSIQHAVEHMTLATESTNPKPKERVDHFIRASLHLLKAKQYYLALSRSSDTDVEAGVLGSLLHSFVLQLDIVSHT